MFPDTEEALAWSFISDGDCLIGRGKLMWDSQEEHQRWACLYCAYCALIVTV